MSPLDRELAAALVRELSPRCPCGVPADTEPQFHKRSAVHDCAHHYRRSCGWCRTVERLIGGCEARLYVEANHGPFVVRKGDV